MEAWQSLTADLTVQNADARATAWIDQELPRMPYRHADFAGRGIVTCAGGLKYSIPAYVLVRALRHVGCTLPIQLWYRGAAEFLPAMQQAMQPYDVQWVDAYRVRERCPHARLNGFELKPYAIQHSPFAEVLFLDADNVPTKDPTYLFDDPRFRTTGTILWPDYGRLARNRQAWQAWGVPYRDEPEIESGQVLVDKAVAWPALCFANYCGERSAFYFRHVHGDKELFHLCWRRLGIPYEMPARGIATLQSGTDHTMCQHDLDGARVFQHRNFGKWQLFQNRPQPGFQLESECLNWLDELRRIYSPAACTLASDQDQQDQAAAAGRYLYTRVGSDQRAMTLAPSGQITAGSAGRETYWTIRDGRLLIAGADGRLTMDLVPAPARSWVGRWLTHEQMPVTLVPA